MNLLSTQQAAEKLGVSERRVRSLITEGKLVAHRLGRDYAIEENVLSNVLVYGKRGRPKKPDEETPAAVVVTKPVRLKPVPTPALIPETKTAGKQATPKARAETKKTAAGQGALAATKRKTKVAAVTAAPKPKRAGKKGAQQ